VFEKIQHIGYLTSDLDAAIAWFEKSFGATHAGGGPLGKIYALPSGGRNAYVRFGNAEAELLEPEDKSGLASNALTMHHVGYVVADIDKTVDKLTSRGFKFAGDKPFTNVMGQQVLYFDASTTNGAMVHLTQLPGEADSNAPRQGLEIEGIVHAGYRVKNLDKAIAIETAEGKKVKENWLRMKAAIYFEKKDTKNYKPHFSKMSKYRFSGFLG